MHPSVIVNSVAVIIGSSIGLLIGKTLTDRIRNMIFQAVGLTTLGVGIQMLLETDSFVVVLLSLVVGAALGEWWNIEHRISLLTKLVGQSESANFTKGFVAAVTLFLVGPITVVGSIRAGLTNDGSLIYVKSVLDMISSVVLSSLYGLGVMLSAAAVFIVQGSLVLFASNLQFLTDSTYLNDFTGVGGAIVVALGIRLLNIKELKAANFLPALILVPLFDLVFSLFGG